SRKWLIRVCGRDSAGGKPTVLRGLAGVAGNRARFADSAEYGRTSRSTATHGQDAHATGNAASPGVGRRAVEFGFDDAEGAARWARLVLAVDVLFAGDFGQVQRVGGLNIAGELD